jgi:hypothetical protein
MSLDPFDIKTVILAKHAQHVVLIHFPIALFTTSVAFDYLGQGTKNRALAAAKIPFADRSGRGVACGIDGASRRVSEWRKRARVDAGSHIAKGGFQAPWRRLTRT